MQERIITNIMDKYITRIGNFSFWKLSKENLFSLAEFVVKENYTHHGVGVSTAEEIRAEVEMVYFEECMNYDNSAIIVAKDEKETIVGTIRVMKWNGCTQLPLTKMFGDELLQQEDLNLNAYEHKWHIGRFAVKKEMQESKQTMTLFRILMVYAISPIFKYNDGVLFAECDKKLLRVMRLMRIEAHNMHDGIYYLGSETIPVYITRSGLTSFLLSNVALTLNIDVESGHEKQDQANDSESRAVKQDKAYMQAAMVS